MSSVSSWHWPSLAPEKSTLQKAGQKQPAHHTMALVTQHLGNKTLAQPCLELPAQGSPEAVQDPPRFKDLAIPPGLLPGLEVLLQCPPPMEQTHQGLLPASKNLRDAVDWGLERLPSQTEVVEVPTQAPENAHLYRWWETLEQWRAQHLESDSPGFKQSDRQTERQSWVQTPSLLLIVCMNLATFSNFESFLI